MKPNTQFITNIKKRSRWNRKLSGPASRSSGLSRLFSSDAHALRFHQEKSHAQELTEPDSNISRRAASSQTTRAGRRRGARPFPPCNGARKRPKILVQQKALPLKIRGTAEAHKRK